MSLLCQAAKESRSYSIFKEKEILNTNVFFQLIVRVCLLFISYFRCHCSQSFTRSSTTRQSFFKSCLRVFFSSSFTNALSPWEWLNRCRFSWPKSSVLKQLLHAIASYVYSVYDCSFCVCRWLLVYLFFLKVTACNNSNNKKRRIGR